MKSNIRFALIGCGKIGERHVIQIVNHGILSAVCDTSPEKADSFSSQFNVPAYYNINTLLNEQKEVDVVSVCTPNGLHATHSIAALNAAKHVLCEKPMAIKTSDCKDMWRAACQNSRKLFIVKQNRFKPAVALLKKWMDSGKLGTIFSIQVNCFWNRNIEYYKNPWRGTNELDGGTLFTQFSHFIDLLYWMFGDMERIFAMTDNFNHKELVDYEDTGVINFKFKSGTLANMHFSINAYGKSMEGSITVFGSKGTVKIGGQYLDTIDYQHVEGISPEDVLVEKLNIGNLPGPLLNNHNNVYENVCDEISRDVFEEKNVFQAIKTVEIIENIYRSAHTGMPIDM